MAKKDFGKVVTDVVAEPIARKRAQAAEQPVVGKKLAKFKIQLDDTNATKRTFYIRENLGIEFDQFCATARIDKGALLNTMVKEWLEQNKGRVEFEVF